VIAKSGFILGCALRAPQGDLLSNPTSEASKVRLYDELPPAADPGSEIPL
jgi:hypothetical protein